MYMNKACVLLNGFFMYKLYHIKEHKHQFADMFLTFWFWILYLFFGAFVLMDCHSIFNTMTHKACFR